MRGICQTARQGFASFWCKNPTLHFADHYGLELSQRNVPLRLTLRLTHGNMRYKARDSNLNPIGRQFRLYSPARPQPALFRSKSLKLIWTDEWIWAACAKAQSSKGGAAQRSATATTASIAIPEDVSDIGFFVLRFLTLIDTVKCTKAPILQILVNFAGLS